MNLNEVTVGDGGYTYTVEDAPQKNTKQQRSYS